MSYLILSQKKFIPNTCAECINVNNYIKYYGQPLKLSEDLSHFVYIDNNFKLEFIKKINGVYLNSSPAFEGVKGNLKVRAKSYIFRVSNTNELLVIVTTAPLNEGFGDTYHLDHVYFRGMRFEFD